VTRRRGRKGRTRSLTWQVRDFGQKRGGGGGQEFFLSSVRPPVGRRKGVGGTKMAALSFPPLAAGVKKEKKERRDNPTAVSSEWDSGKRGKRRSRSPPIERLT